MLSDEWLPRYRLLENFTAKWNGNGNGNGNGNAYDRGDYNSSFALRAVELKSHHFIPIGAIGCILTKYVRKHIKFPFPYPNDASDKIVLRLARWSERYSSPNVFTD